jgi:hypothetical protein
MFPSKVIIMEEKKRTGFCFECDKNFVINADETANHVDEDGEIDYEEDAHHVPFQIGR